MLPMSWHRVGWLVMACINGGSVWDVACVFGQVRRARQIGRITGKDLKSSSSLPLHGHGRRRTVPFKTALFFFQRKENVIRKNPKIGYDSRPPLYNAYEAKKLLNVLHNKLCKEKKRQMILLSWATCPHNLTVVYFQGRPAHTLTLVYFQGATSSHILIVVYFQGRPAHTRSHWSIFRGDLPTQPHTGLFLRATCPHTLTLVYFQGRPAQVEKEKSGLIVMDDLPKQKNGLNVMGDLPRKILVSL